MDPSEKPASQIAKEARAESDMELLIGYLLLAGVLLSLALVTAGALWNWAATGSLQLSYRLPRGVFFRFLLAGVGQITHRGLGPRVLTNLGIATLLLTPYLRVLASILFFALVERNWKYTLFTTLVFAVLTYSLFLRQ